MENSTTLQLYGLLDRSGSMVPIAGDVIGGFNALLTGQQGDGPDARITLAQFDSHDPHEVLADAVPELAALLLSAADFVPPGGMPLLDLTGLTSPVPAPAQPPAPYSTRQRRTPCW